MWDKRTTLVKQATFLPLFEVSQSTRIHKIRFCEIWRLDQPGSSKQEDVKWNPFQPPPRKALPSPIFPDWDWISLSPNVQVPGIPFLSHFPLPENHKVRGNLYKQPENSKLFCQVLLPFPPIPGHSTTSSLPVNQLDLLLLYLFALLFHLKLKLVSISDSLYSWLSSPSNPFAIQPPPHSIEILSIHDDLSHQTELLICHFIEIPSSKNVRLIQIVESTLHPLFSPFVPRSHPTPPSI